MSKEMTLDGNELHTQHFKNSLNHESVVDLISMAILIATLSSYPRRDEARMVATTILENLLTWSLEHRSLSPSSPFSPLSQS